MKMHIQTFVFASMTDINLFQIVLVFVSMTDNIMKYATSEGSQAQLKLCFNLLTLCTQISEARFLKKNM